MLGAVIVGAWLVEAKQSVIENMAPVLTRLFTPLFTVTLLVFLATMAWTGRGIDIERDVLIAFDLLLVLVLALLLYSVSARDPQAPPGAFDCCWCCC
jgi:heme A synthase